MNTSKPSWCLKKRLLFCINHIAPLYTIHSPLFSIGSFLVFFKIALASITFAVYSICKSIRSPCVLSLDVQSLLSRDVFPGEADHPSRLPRIFFSIWCTKMDFSLSRSIACTWIGSPMLPKMLSHRHSNSGCKPFILPLELFKEKSRSLVDNQTMVVKCPRKCMDTGAFCLGC